MRLIYFDTVHAIKTHDVIIRVSGGLMGSIDTGRLDSILNQIQNDDYYPEFQDKITHLVYAVNKGHLFNDGNKRTSIALGAFFLEVNGLSSLGSKFIIEMENIAVAIANNLVDKILLHEIILSILMEDDYNETLKLKVIEALSHGETDDSEDLEFNSPTTPFS